MDGAVGSLFPHHSWLRFSPEPNPRALASCDSVRMVNHVICLVTKSQASLRSICHGREKQTDVRVGSVHYRPADGEEYVILGRPATGDHAWFGFMIPDAHLSGITSSEGVAAPGEYHEQVLYGDARLQSYLMRLADSDGPFDPRHHDGKETVARLLALRLAELSGARAPDWQADSSVFDRRSLRHLVAYIDDHLQVAPALSDVAVLVGLSPSHFAQKFRQSTGLSLHRFVNRRRIMRSLDSLKAPSTSVAHVGIELGFSSQSHFTRLFSDLTGMTPAKYRKRFRRVVG